MMLSPIIGKHHSQNTPSNEGWSDAAHDGLFREMLKLLKCKCVSLDLAASAQAVGRDGSLAKNPDRQGYWPATQHMIGSASLAQSETMHNSRLTCQWLDLHPERQKLD